jgi:transcriptional regulator with XRE-family HTH domain
MSAIAPLSPLHAAFGEALLELREERGISQERLALDSELDPLIYGEAERGEHNLSLAHIGTLAQALEVPASAIHARAERLLGKPG